MPNLQYLERSLPSQIPTSRLHRHGSVIYVLYFELDALLSAQRCEFGLFSVRGLFVPEDGLFVLQVQFWIAVAPTRFLLSHCIKSIPVEMNNTYAFSEATCIWRVNSMNL
jgi:hypothetical protein